MTLTTQVVIIAILLVGNYFAVSIFRGIFRWQMINRYHYDYYDGQALSRTGQYWHCFNREVFRLPTVLFTLGFAAIEVSGLYLLLIA